MARKSNVLLGLLTGIAFTWNPASAGTCVIVGVVMDESGSMRGAQEWISTDVLPKLFTDISSEGFGPNYLCSIGFEREPRNLGCGEWDAATYTNPYQIAGGVEDGYLAIAFADGEVDALPVDSSCDATIRVGILVTDEERSEVSSTDTLATTTALLIEDGWIMNTVVDNLGSSGSILGVTQEPIPNEGDVETYTTYSSDGSGGFVTTADVSQSPFSPGRGVRDYAPLAYATGGGVWNLNLLDSGGILAEAFTNAFISIKIQEIIAVAPTPSPTPAPTYPAPTLAPTVAPTTMPTGSPIPTPPPTYPTTPPPTYPTTPPPTHPEECLDQDCTQCQNLCGAQGLTCFIDNSCSGGSTSRSYAARNQQGCNLFGIPTCRRCDKLYGDASCPADTSCPPKPGCYDAPTPTPTGDPTPAPPTYPTTPPPTPPEDCLDQDCTQCQNMCGAQGLTCFIDNSCSGRSTSRSYAARNQQGCNLFGMPTCRRCDMLSGDASCPADTSCPPKPGCDDPPTPTPTYVATPPPTYVPTPPPTYLTTPPPTHPPTYAPVPDECAAACLAANPYEPCVFDKTCPGGESPPPGQYEDSGLGCGALIKKVSTSECRYCGFGRFQACPV